MKTQESISKIINTLFCNQHLTAIEGKKEIGLSPKQLSRDDVLSQLCDLEFLIFRNGAKKRKHDELNEKDNWSKKSIFVKLPYWRTLLLRNNLDVMHIEKNVCDSIIGTLMSTKKKQKIT